MEAFDYIIVGFGKGGKTLAKDLAERGKTVAMIEESKEMYGGTCINIACIPTKYLIHQAQEKDVNQNDDDFYKETIENKNATIAKLREANYKNLAGEESVTVYTAKATFISDKQIQLTRETETQDLTADYFIINTGSLPVIPPIDGLEETDNIYTSTELQEVTDLPKELLIAGGGYIGLEFASLYESLGSKVTIIDSSKAFMEKEDRDIAEAVKESFQERNIKIISDSKVTAVANEDNGVLITYEDSDGTKGKLTGSALLLATGRKPNTGDLDLTKAGVKLDDHGAIEVNEYLKTNVDHIWAIGDVNGGPQFTYISLDDYRIIRDQIFEMGDHNLNKRKNIPFSVFIEPTFSHVGLNENTAKEKGIDYEVVTMPAAAIPRTKINYKPTGMLKALIDPNTKQILGCTLFCAASSEMINIVRVAIEANMPYTFLRDNIFTHPTMSEGLNDLFKMFG